MKQVVIICLSLLLLWTPFANAQLGAELHLTGVANKLDDWNLDYNGKLLVDFQERGSGYRFDAQMSAEWTGKEAESLDLGLERLSARIYGSPWDLSLGKQPITWGVGQSWPVVQSPLNIYPGNVWGLNLRIPTSPLGFWTITAAEVDSDVWYSARKQDYWDGLRWSAMVATDREQTVFGADGKLDVGVEIYGDVLFYLKPDYDIKLLVGTDYPLGPLTGITEVRYDSTRPELLGRTHVFQAVRYGFDEFSGVSLAADLNLKDKSSMFILSGDTLWTDQISISAAIMVPLGENGSEYGLLKEVQGKQFSIRLEYLF